jgi:mRNA-degrading endonuclease RelE of RelBE toxin-antitoxin system
MDLVSKFLKKLDQKRRQEIEALLLQIKRRELGRLDIKKLKGSDSLFRVRKGNIRVFFSVDRNPVSKGSEVSIISIDFRTDTTYR